MPFVSLPPLVDRGFTVIGESPIQGKGVFALKFIPQGTRLFEYTGFKMKYDDLFEDYIQGKSSMRYVINLDDEYIIDGERGGNDSRYINHSCDPNCEVYFLNDTIFIYANLDIETGTELSFDYQLGLLFEENEIIEKIKKWNPCNCGSPKCRGTMMLL
ncbi:MAG: SET domain-containing protein-lysine N-methyltransferase [Saprospiraceae bacterium]|nr:SET domain-containing protein-lysine N-methyltransferase [Saprospiraceae bacterium]